jgi:hypothetical protein
MSNQPPGFPNYSGKILAITMENPGPPTHQPPPHVLKNVELLDIGGRVFIQGNHALDSPLSMTGAKVMLPWDKVLRIFLFDSAEQFFTFQATQPQRPNFPGLF